MKTITKILAIWLVVTLVLALAGCTSQKSTPNNTSTDPTPAAQSNNATVFKSADGKIEISAPEGWTEENLGNADAVLQVANVPEDIYFMVITEPKTDFADNVAVADYNKMVLDNMKSSISSLQETSPQSMTINGCDALQYEFVADIETVKLKYLMTTLESENSFTQILAWSLNSNFDSNKEVFKSIAGSIKIND